MKKTTILIILLLCSKIYSQTTTEILIPAGIAALTFVAIDANKKEVAKEISQFRSKEYIMDFIIGPAKNKEVKFEAESLASDDSAGLISVAFNCNEVNERGLLLAFFGNNKDASGSTGLAYGFRYIPLIEAQNLLKRIDDVQERHKKYISDDNDVNNIYIEFENIRFILYRDGGDKIRVFWNGFEVTWERAAFDRTKRRLDRWFD
ncbi:hypothetical protein OO010_07425 [Flavobacteriaceae bacterium KMM 6898]|nr:hypothetical protein [Flavobacteriaceae bacterium KMM 6898]